MLHISVSLFLSGLDFLYLGAYLLFNGTTEIIDTSFCEFFIWFRYYPSKQYEVDKNHCPFFVLLLGPNDVNPYYTESYSFHEVPIINC